MTTRPSVTDTVLNPSLAARLSFLLYRRRFLINYTAIGIFSLVLEVIVLRALERSGVPFQFAVLAGVASSVGAAYWLNVRFNFKVPRAKRGRAMAYFATISLLSAGMNYMLRQPLRTLGWTYEQARIASSAALFLAAYALHRRFTFSDAKQVGIAVYVDTAEDIRGVWRKVGAYPSFIHVDLVDETFNPDCRAPLPNRTEVVHAFWPDKELHAHLMSRRPLRWLPNVLPFADVIIVHRECDDDLDTVFAQIHASDKRAALAMRLDTPTASLRPYLDRVSMIMVLAIADPGRSGQSFQMACLEIIAELNSWPEREHLSLCVDGGVNEHNVSLLNVERVVSGSSVLNHREPTRQIMRLQTSSSYEAV